MNKNTIFINIKNTTLSALLPLLLVACGSKNNNVDAELADIDARIAATNVQLDSLQAQTEKLLTDSLSRDPKIANLSKEMEKREKLIAKYKAPKDSLRRKAYAAKLGSFRMDSILHANRVKEQIVNSRKDAFHALYLEQDMLKAKRDSLLKIKSR